MISMYDLEDNLITIFDSYKECAEYFKTTVEVIQCYICRKNKGIIDKKRLDGKWYRLYKIDEIVSIKRLTTDDLIIESVK